MLLHIHFLFFVAIIFSRIEARTLDSPPIAKISPNYQKVSLLNKNLAFLSAANSKDNTNVLTYYWKLLKSPRGYEHRKFDRTEIVVLENLIPGVFEVLLTVSDLNMANDTDLARIDVVEGFGDFFVQKARHGIWKYKTYAVFSNFHQIKTLLNKTFSNLNVLKLGEETTRGKEKLEQMPCLVSNFCRVLLHALFHATTDRRKARENSRSPLKLRM